MEVVVNRVRTGGIGIRVQVLDLGSWTGYGLTPSRLSSV